MCKQCHVLRCDYKFTDMEWNMAAWPASRQGRCKDCMRKSEKHMWHCAGCDKTEPTPQYFSEWLQGRLQQRRRAGTRCNYCARKAKEEQGERQHKSVSMVVKHTDPMTEALAAPAINVQIWCRNCMSPKDVHQCLPAWRFQTQLL